MLEEKDLKVVEVMLHELCKQHSKKYRDWVVAANPSSYDFTAPQCNEVYSRPECIFHYCSETNGQKCLKENKCLHPK